MKTLFVTHNNWNTIKQRSHFLSEKLNRKKNNVTIAYKWSPKKFNYSKNETKLKLIPCLFFPFSLLSVKIFRDIDKFIWNSYFIKIINHHHYDNIIITHPLFYRYFKNIKKIKIIFDCHDDSELFYKKSKLKELIKRENLNLLRDSNLNIFSSKNLLNKYKKYGNKNILVRNGHFLKTKKIPNILKTNKVSNKKFNIFYFGTVSSWFDFNVIKIILKNFKNIHITIIGPVDTKVLIHKNIHYIKPLEHEELIRFSSKADAFIMPFKLNQLIRSVDPVKLYEYLIFKKPVISVFYSELIFFQKFIDFYKNEKDITFTIKKILKRKILKNDKLVNEFLKDNTWIKRAKKFNEELRKI